MEDSGGRRWCGGLRGGGVLERGVGGGADFLEFPFSVRSLVALLRFVGKDRLGDFKYQLMDTKENVCVSLWRVERFNDGMG